MTLRTAILALAPTIYWPMDGATGPAAADATGNGHSGFFTANVSLGAAGPEAGTTCVATSAGDAGVTLFGVNPLTGTGPFTVAAWIALTLPLAAQKTLIYNGREDATGCGVTIGVNGQLAVLVGARYQSNSDGLLTLGRWHQVALVFVNNGNRVTYLDGAPVETIAASFDNAVAADQPAHCWTPGPGLLAHAAFWNSALTAANILSMWTAGPGLNTIADNPAAGTSVAASGDAILAILAQILAAVRKTY